MTEEERKKLELQKQQQNAQTQIAKQSNENMNLAMQPSNNVLQAQQYLQQQLEQKPTSYQGANAQQMNALMQNIINRGQFEYNPNADAGWQAYKNMWIQNGQRAMQDTIANQAALTGGYANSYAGAVGQQQYQQHLREMGSAMPQFMQMAADRYDREGDTMSSNLALMQQMDDEEYARYRDQMSDWQNERNYLTGRYDQEYINWLAEREYADNRDDIENERKYQELAYRADAYGLAMNMLANGMMPDDNMLANAGITMEQAKQMLDRLRGGSGGNEQRTDNGETKGIIPTIVGSVGNGINAAVNRGINAAVNKGVNTWKENLVDGPMEFIKNAVKGTQNTEEYKALKKKYTNYSEKELDELYKILYQ